MGNVPERIWATEDTAHFGEDRFHSTTPMRGLTEYLRADIAAAREADLRAEVSKRDKVIAKAYGRVTAVVQSVCDEGDRVYFGSSNDADILRDLSREWDDARILKEDIRTSEEEVRDLRALLDVARNDLEALAGFTPLYDYVQGAKMDEPGSPFDRGRQRAYGEMQARIRATLAKIGGQHD